MALFLIDIRGPCMLDWCFGLDTVTGWGFPTGVELWEEWESIALKAKFLTSVFSGP
jgi:hypothetical protein